MPTQEERELAVRLKLNPIKEAIKGKKIILIDDSIVRGTTSKQLLDLVKEAEPAEIHFLVGCPPVMAPCYYGVAMATKKELIAANYSVEEIQEQLDSNMELKTVYMVQLLRGEEKVQPAGLIKVKIKLTESQKLCTDLRVYHVDDQNNMTVYDSHVEDGYIVFETDHLSYWAIVGNVIDANQLGNSMPTNSTIVIIAFALLAISCMAFCLIMIAQKKRQKCLKKNMKMYSYASQQNAAL